MVLDPGSGFMDLMFEALLSLMTREPFGEFVQRLRARCQHNTWVVHLSFPAICFPTAHHCDVVLSLSLPTYSKETLHFLSSDDGNEIRWIVSSRAIVREKRRHVSRVHAAALLNFFSF